MGKSNLFVIEADELNRQFLNLFPNTLVLTNIESDHLDYYKDLNDIKSAFMEFIKKVPDEGKILYNRDDQASRELMEFIHHPNEISFGKKSKDVALKKIESSGRMQNFEVKFKSGKKTEKFQIQVPGEFNVYNALAAIAVARQYDVSLDVIRQVLADYKGIWRRFEKIGQFGTIDIVSDYAHHPTSILATMKAAREFYPEARILLVFQPHQKKRTQLLFEELAVSLTLAAPDKLVLMEIFDVAGRERKDDAKGIDLFERVSKTFPEVEFYPDLQTTLEGVKKQISNFDLVIFMGAGDIYKIADKLVKQQT